MPGFELSDLGHQMAHAAALELADTGREVGTLYASPLIRAQQSADPIARMLKRDIVTEERIIEPTNFFEGKVNSGPDAAFKNPRYWYKFWNPARPSWGEPYKRIAKRVRAAMDDAWDRAEAKEIDGDIVMVSHQSPIWMAHLDVAGKRLAHNPATRRCDLSSITTFERRADGWVEVSYRTPAKPLMDDALDVGAV